MHGQMLTDLNPLGICVGSEIEDADLKVFSMIKGINESKTPIKHIPCECRCEFDGKSVIQNNGIMISASINVKIQ